MHIYKLLLIFILSTSLFSAESRIINGSQVSDSDEQWRFIVSLQYNDSLYCGGSLIAPNWVLTAAHCLVDKNGVVYVPDTWDTVNVGDYNLIQATAYGVKQFIVHDDYNATTLDNDIGLVELSSDTVNIPSISYDRTHSLVADTQTEVAGWGNMSTTEDDFPEDLMEALVPIVDYETCNGLTSYNGEITQNMICAGYMDGRRDSCQGDSGGPLIAYENSEWQQVGIVSWGVNCAQKDYPGVYTKVQNYDSWIDAHTGIVPPVESPSPINPAIIMYLLQ